MLSWRLRWYVLATARVLHRHWQALSLAVLLLLPTMPVFAQARLLGAPILAPLAPAHGFEWRFVWVHMLEAIGMLWVLIQRTAISGGPFAVFAKSLPVSDRHHRTLDAIVVLIASTPLLLPIISAAIAFAYLPDKVSNYLYVIGLMTITLGWQLAALSRNIGHGTPLVVANFILIGALQTGNAARTTLLVASLIIAAVALVKTPAASSSHARRFGTTWRRLAGHVSANAARRLPAFVKLQFGILGFHFAGTVSRCVVMGAVAVSTCYVVDLWSFDARVVPLTLVAQAAIALIAATIYRDLQASHVRAAHFVRSLPLGSVVQVRADVLTVATLALPFAAAAPLFLVVHGVLSVHVAVAIVLAGAPLLALLRLPQRYAPGESVLLGAILAVTWIVIAWQIFV
ncbi:putative membrane protein [Burkholderia cenocepacia]|uniref:Membrane protein n=1 Tax=Burkholderia cenocepacia TaxID=95486 RepID=A0AAN0RZI1_9BURK|nr:putative membrane protein [Burkholderia cenocepacia]